MNVEKESSANQHKYSRMQTQLMVIAYKIPSGKFMIHVSIV